MSNPSEERESISKFGVHRFRSILKGKNGKKVEMFQVLNLSGTSIRKKQSDSTSNEEDDPRIVNLRATYQSILRDDLPPGLPPCREIYHAIETEENAKPPHRQLFCLSPEELVATKD